MKTYGGVDIYIKVLLTSALVGGRDQLHALVALPPGERATGTHWVGDWVSPRAGLDDLRSENSLIKLNHWTNLRSQQVLCVF
jgi:hypothetical protein